MSVDVEVHGRPSPLWFEEVGRAALTEFVGSDLVDESVVRVDVLPDESGSLDVVLQISSPDRGRLLAQYVPFAEDSHNGFALPFVRGWIASELSRMSDAPTVRLHLDVAQTTPNPPPLYTVEHLGDAQSLVDERLQRSFERHGIDLVLLAGNVVAGPSPALLDIVARRLADHSVDHLIDGCSGSGAVATVALSAGVRRVTSIDVRSWDRVHERLGGSVGWRFVQDDAIDALKDLSPLGDAVVVLDPFWGEALRTVTRLTNFPLGDAELILNGGPYLLPAWQSRLHSGLSGLARSVRYADVLGERIYTLSSSDR